jgi:hypothetical protein
MSMLDGFSGYNQVLVAEEDREKITFITSSSIKGHMYILTATDYFTKWPEIVELKKYDSEELIKFLKIIFYQYLVSQTNLSLIMV